MSFRNFFNALTEPPLTFRKRKQRITFVLAGLCLVTVGVWLVWALIDSRGLLPGKSEDPSISTTTLPKTFTSSVQYWAEDIQTWSVQYELDPILIATVMQIESCGNPDVISHAGAVGLFQVMPFHFVGDELMTDPKINASRGLTYLAQSYQLANGDIKLTLAGYNGGHGQISRARILWPDETRRYVDWGFGIYQEAKMEDSTSPTLAAWLNAGGFRLCDQAEIQLGFE
jgi:hypothetical protein